MNMNMNGFEYKKRYDPELGRYVKKNIYSGEIQAGGGLTDIFKSTIKKAVKRGLQKVARKTGERVSKKAGDKITQLLRSKNEASQASHLHRSFYLHNHHHIHKCLCHRMRLMRELTD